MTKVNAVVCTIKMIVLRNYTTHSVLPSKEKKTLNKIIREIVFTTHIDQQYSYVKKIINSCKRNIFKN